MPPEQVFKTLVARGDNHGVCLAVVPGNCELDLKALARATGEAVRAQLSQPSTLDCDCRRAVQLFCNPDNAITVLLGLQRSGTR